VNSRISRSFGLLALATIVQACGSSPEGPSPSALRVTSVRPSAGSTLGGTIVTVSGANFSAGANVTIGGTTASQVTVVDSMTITAAAPPHAAGSADVSVTMNGQTASLPAAFTYVTNTPPSIASIVVRGAKPREPAQFADLDETVNVSATVTDAETPVSELTFSWSADSGTFSGGQANVSWTAPHTFSTPGTVTLTLTVTERFQGTSATGQPVSGENQVKGTATVRLHDSAREVGNLAVDFLTAFSRQLDPVQVMRNFSSQCGGTAAELEDVQHNQADFTITAYNIGAPSTTVGFTGRCPFRNRQGDACAFVPAEWHSFIKAATYHPDLKPYIGRTMNVTGTDQVTAVLENDQWKLCASDWDQATATFTSMDGRPAVATGARFKR
jgi:hypothetical protein